MGRKLFTLRAQCLFSALLLGTGGLLFMPVPVRAQQEIVPLSNAPAGQQKNGNLETEIVEIRNGVGSPALIARRPGQFILLVRELDQTPQPESFILFATTAQADANQSLPATEPLLRLERKAGNPRRSLAGIVNLTAGEFSRPPPARASAPLRASRINE